MISYKNILTIFAASLAGVVFSLSFTPSFAEDAKKDGSEEVALKPIKNLPEDYAFSILRKGKKIGEHKIAFSEKDGNTIVDIDINIRVGVGPITFYRYEHSNQEIWDDEGLLEITTATNENGKSFALEGKRKDEGFEIIKGEEPGMVEASIIPTSYWRMETLDVSRVLDTQNGKVLDVAVDQKGDAGDLGTKYIMSGELELDLWYTDDRLTKIAFDAEGASIEYGPLKGDES